MLFRWWLSTWLMTGPRTGSFAWMALLTSHVRQLTRPQPPTLGKSDYICHPLRMVDSRTKPPYRPPRSGFGLPPGKSDYICHPLRTWAAAQKPAPWSLSLQVPPGKSDYICHPAADGSHTKPPAPGVPASQENS